MKEKFKTIWKIILVLLAFFIFLGIADTCIIVLPVIKNFNSIYLRGIVQNIIILFTILMFLEGTIKEKFRELKLIFKVEYYRLFFVGVIIGFLGVVVILAIGVILEITKYRNIGITSYNNVISALLINLSLFLSVGFGEEVLSRGYILKQLLNCGGKVWAVLMSSLIFMLLHIGTYSKFLDFADVFLAGILLAIMYIKSNSLWLSIGFHFMWDFTQSYIINIEKSLFSTKAIFRFNVPKDIYICNIDIGCRFEIIFIIVELLLIASVLYVYKRKNFTLGFQ